MIGNQEEHEGHNMKIPAWTEDHYWTVRAWATRAYLVLRHRPLVKCPMCNGKGGEMQGYYEPEWSECWYCYDFWGELEEWRCEWFVGRVPVLAWLRGRILTRLGHGFSMSHGRVRWAILCRLGWHKWQDDECLGRHCWRCYESAPRSKTKAPSANERI